MDVINSSSDKVEVDMNELTFTEKTSTIDRAKIDQLIDETIKMLTENDKKIMGLEDKSDAEIKKQFEDLLDKNDDIKDRLKQVKEIKFVKDIDT